MASPDAPPGLDGLADDWEACGIIRQRARRSSSLLVWPSVESAGVPSMTLSCTQLQHVTTHGEI